jgi:hypothetical protein
VQKIGPIVYQTYPLEEIANAQEQFLTKKHTGKNRADGQQQVLENTGTIDLLYPTQSARWRKV